MVEDEMDDRAQIIKDSLVELSNNMISFLVIIALLIRIWLLLLFNVIVSLFLIVNIVNDFIMRANTQEEIQD